MDSKSTSNRNEYLDPLEDFHDRQQVLDLFEKLLSAARPGRFHLLAIKGNSGTGKTFLTSYLAERICPALGWQSGQMRFSRSEPDFRSILRGIEDGLKGCVPNKSLEN